MKKSSKQNNKNGKGILKGISGCDVGDEGEEKND
jgi:hypothetical protein